MRTIQSQDAAFDPKKNRVLTVVMGALLWGFAWQIRGNGTSDPSVVILLFLLFLSIHYSPRQKFNLVVFAFAVFVFGIMRTGWGTFVGQAGIPGLYPGHIVSDVAENARGAGFDIVVPWWQGYFWLFIVGLSWASLPSLLFGGYFFTKFTYSWKHLAIIVVLFITGKYIGGFVAQLVIPLLAPQAYYELYLPGLSKRNYGSMHGNLSTALAIIPVFLYLQFRVKDGGFVRRSVVIMLIFGTGLSGAAFWHAIGRNNAHWQLPFWSLWEYTSGFIIGGLLFWFYGRLSEKELQESDISPGLEWIGRRGMLGQFILYSIALYFFVLYGLLNSLGGSLKITRAWLGAEPFAAAWKIELVLLAVVLLAFWFYLRGSLGTAWSKKSFREKSLIAFIVLLPLNYLFFLFPFIAAGRLSQLNSAAWADTISFLVVEAYGIYLYRWFNSPPVAAGALREARSGASD